MTKVNKQDPHGVDLQDALDVDQLPEGQQEEVMQIERVTREELAKLRAELDNLVTAA